MSATREDIENMTHTEAINYLRVKIHAYNNGIRWCKKMLDEYGDPK